MSKNEIRVQWISAFVLVFKATLAFPSSDALPRDYYMLHLRNPLMRYYDYAIYSMGSDDTYVINTVPNLLSGLSDRSNVELNSHSTSANNQHALGHTEFNSNSRINLSGFGRRVPVFEHYDFNKRRHSYLKPVMTTTVAPYANTWKPIRSNEQTFDIQLTKSITVSSPGAWVNSHKSPVTKPFPNLPPGSQIPIRETHAKFSNHSLNQGGPTLLNDGVGGSNNSSLDKLIKTPTWKPYPATGLSQNTELSFEKAFAPFQDSRTDEPIDVNNGHPKILFRVNHSFRNGRVRAKGNNASVPHFNGNPRHSAKLTPRGNKLLIRTTKPTISSKPSIIFHRQLDPKNAFSTGQERRENFRNTPFVYHKVANTASRGNSTEPEINTAVKPRWSGRQIEEGLHIQPLFDNHSKAPRNDPRTSAEKINPEKNLELSPNDRNNGWKEFFDSGRLNPITLVVSNKTYSPAVTHSPFSNHERRQNSLPMTELSTASVSLSKFPRKYSQNNFEFTTTMRTYFAATIPTDFFTQVTVDGIRASSGEVIQDTTSAISNYILKNDNQELSESENVDVRHVPELPEVKQNKPPVSSAPKVKITGGVLAGVLIASLIFLGFLTGAAVYTFHQWKFSKYREKPRKNQPTYSSEYLDNSFTGNTYIHNNIYLPTPQNIEELSSVDSDSFISGIEAVAVQNYSSENAKNTAV